jgi:hypothetical protein
MHALPSHPKSRSNKRRSRLSIFPIQQMRNQDQIAINANIITRIAEDLRLGSSNIRNGGAIIYNSTSAKISFPQYLEAAYQGPQKSQPC